MAEWESASSAFTVMMAESAHLTARCRRSDREHTDHVQGRLTWASRTGAEGMQPFEYFKYRYYENGSWGSVTLSIAATWTQTS
jgi:nitrile hydratase